MSPTRNEIARALNEGESKLRAWESSGALPTFGTVPVADYRDRARMIVAMRDGGLSMQRLRRVLAAGASREAGMTKWQRLKERTDELQAAAFARGDDLSFTAALRELERRGDVAFKEYFEARAIAMAEDSQPGGGGRLAMLHETPAKETADE